MSVAGYNANADRPHDRTTLGIVELKRLIEAAPSGPYYSGMYGVSRQLCYRLAGSTGMRFSEIKITTTVSFALDCDLPTVTVAAGYTKNGEPAKMPCPKTGPPTSKSGWQEIL